MSRFKGILLGTLVVLALGTPIAVHAAVQYDAILEWNGPYYRVINAPTVNQMVDNPVIDVPFILPYAVAVSQKADDRDVVYVLDSGNKRIQAFEANAVYVNDNTFVWNAGGAAAAGEYDDDEIWLDEYVNPAEDFVLPGSEVVVIDGDVWTRVANLTGFVAADKVYTIDYAADPGPIIDLPASSLSDESSITLNYAITDYEGGGTAAFGVGDVDYGTSEGASVVMQTITEGTSTGPTSFGNLRSIAAVANMTDGTSDDLFVLDSEGSTTLFYYFMDADGSITYREAYDDLLTNPYDVAVARGGPTRVAAAAVTGGGDIVGGATVRDASQVTGHVYTVVEAVGNVTVTNVTTGRVLVNEAVRADMAATFLGIPGLDVTIDNGAGTGSNTLTTTKAVSDRYLFVADTGADRIKVISADPADPTATNDWLPGDEHTSAAQPAGAGLVGATADIDYRYTIAAATPDRVIFTNAFPIAENSLETITFDPGGASEAEWTRVDDLGVTGPDDEVFEIDWQTGMIRFGDGIHGMVAPVGTWELGTYETTPDVLRYGTSGTGPGRFAAPRGVTARWNSSLGVYDVYVADTGNGRIQKFAFHPADSGIPARMEYVCQWSIASSANDLLSNPVDVIVGVDGNDDVYVAVADQGNSRIVIYKDLAAASSGGSTAPIWDTTLGDAGNSLGLFAQIEGIAFMPNGSDFDIYACDALRGTVTKYQESPTPTITLSFAGQSELPNCFPPSSSYRFSFTTSNVPAGGWIDFYYDTVTTFNAATAKLAFPVGTTPATATSATWVFSQSPGGTPPDRSLAEGGYYLFARMKDSNGVTVATAAAGANRLLCIDSSLLPSLMLADAIDGDYYLYLQNNLERVVKLQVAYPDSVITVGYSGTFDPALVTVEGIAPGDGWDESGYNLSQTLTGFDNTNGTFTVSSAALETPIGLTSVGPHTMAMMTVKADAAAITPETRFANGEITILTTGSGMSNIHGESPEMMTIQNILLRFGYLGDLATAGEGADGYLPNLAPKPDGIIGYDDLVVFSLGWNGVNGVRDQIADIGPISGTAPDVISMPDGQWDVDDILAFTTMYSWYANQGFARAIPGSNLNFSTDSRPVVAGDPVPGQATARTVSHLVSPKVGDLMTVDLVVENADNLTTALFNLGFDPDQLELVSIENGGHLEGASGSLFLHRCGLGWLEAMAARLDQDTPGVSGSGVVARATFRILDDNPGDIDLGFDLRSESGMVLARGNRDLGPFSGGEASFRLYSARPNPVHSTTTIVFSLPEAGPANLSVYDVSGRKVSSLASGRHESGFHVVSFDGMSDRGELLPAGVYFYRLQAGQNETTRKLILTR